MARKWYDFDSRQRTDFVGEGINEKWWVKHRSIGKENSDDVSPYLLANEWICGCVAQALRLPVPPFALMRSSSSSRGMFVSWKFGSKTSIPADARPDRCVSAMADTCTGILFFDILVANSDRWEKNIKVDNPDSPTQLEIFDHERALFGWFAGDGKKRLQDLFENLGVGAGPLTGGTRHCFLDTLNTTEFFAKWIDRIGKIPDFFIDEICREAPSVNQDEQLTAFDFLKNRKRELANIIDKHRNCFASVESGKTLRSG